MAGKRVWIITGGSRGLGLSLAQQVAAGGDGIVTCARNPQALETAVATIDGLGGQVLALPGDVADPEFAATLVQRTLDHFGSIDVLLNNASILGLSPQPRLAAYPVDVLRRVYETNVAAPLQLVQLILPHMQAQQSGMIINITSDAAQAGYAGWGGYGSSKAALEALTKTLATELAGTGVHAVAVDPGDMRTQMHQEAFPGEDISDRPLPEIAVPALLWLGRNGPAGNAWRYQAQNWSPPAA